MTEIAHRKASDRCCGNCRRYEFWIDPDEHETPGACSLTGEGTDIDFLCEDFEGHTSAYLPLEGAVIH